MLKQIKIKNINASDYAKLSAFASFFIGVLVGIIYILIGVLTMFSSRSASEASSFMQLGGIFYIFCGIFYPFFLAAISWLFGYIGTGLINWLLKRTGGVRVDIEEVGNVTYA